MSRSPSPSASKKPAPAPVISGREKFPSSPASWTKRMPASSVTSVNPCAEAKPAVPTVMTSAVVKWVPARRLKARSV